MRALIIILLTLFLTSGLWSQRTSRKPKVVVVEQAEGVEVDTLMGNPDSLHLAGFDKPLRSRKETFFATNHSSRAVAEMALTVVYYDLAGRQLHRRHLRISRYIKPGETQNIAIPSWDLQQSFYYIRSEKPKRVEQATPFSVTISVDTLFIAR